MELGDLEIEVIGVVAELGEAKPKEIHARMRSRRPIAYTSVTNTLYRLAEKGLLKARRVSEKRVYYSVNRGAPAYESAVASLVDRLVRAFGDSAVSYFVAKEEARRGRRGKP